MAVYPFLPQLALDVDGALAPAGAGQIYAATDTAFTTPLAVTNAAGAPMATVAVTSLGLTQYFQTTDYGTVWWKSGSLPAVALVSHKGYADAAEAARVAAEAAQASADAVAELVTASTDAQIAAVLADPGSASRAEVGSIVDVVPPGGPIAAAIAARNTDPVVIVVAGDSTAASGHVAEPTLRWPNRMAARMHAAWRLTSGSHPAVVTLAAAVASPPAVPGIHVINAGVGGALASNYLTSTTGPQVAALDPHLVFHMIGANDYYYDVSTASYQASIEARLDQLDADATTPPHHMLVHVHEIFSSGVTDGTAHTWAEYGSAMQAIATERANVSFLDLDLVFKMAGLVGTSDSTELIDADQVHASPSGHALVARTICDTLAVPASPVVPDTGWIAVTPSTGWGATAGFPAQVRREGNRVTLIGALTRSGTTGVLTNVATVPDGFRPATNTFLPASVTNGGAVITAYASTSGAIASASGYISGTLASGAIVPLTGTWYVD